jgi:phosphoglycerol transferase
MARVMERYNENTLVTENMASALGMVGTAGFVLLLLWLLRCRSRYSSPRMSAALAEMNLIAVLFATFGGLAILLALCFGGLLRSNNRISIFIAFFALLALADAAGRCFQGSRRRNVIGVGVIAAVVVLGILDQTTSGFVPNYAADKAIFASDRQFVGQIEASLPVGAMVFQLPYIPFPEAVVEDYQLFRGYLHSRELRWSYGSMRGTTADQWARMIAQLAPEEMVKGLKEQKFAGIYIDRKQMPEGGDFEARLAGVLGVAPIVSSDRRLAFYRFP